MYSRPDNVRAYRLGGVTLRIQSSEALASGGNWTAFEADPADDADLNYKIHYVQTLPSEGRVYYDSSNAQPYACVQEGQSTEIFIRDNVLPWGQKVGELFHLLAVQHMLLAKGRLLIHGAFIRYRGKGILFTGRSGIGKTTQARNWQQRYGAESINEDRAILALADGQLTAYGVPVAGSSPVCRNEQAALSAIVVLSQSGENSLRQLPLTEAAARILDGTYQLAEFRSDAPRVNLLAIELAAAQPVYHLACRLGAESAELLHGVLFPE